MRELLCSCKNRGQYDAQMAAVLILLGEIVTDDSGSWRDDPLKYKKRNKDMAALNVKIDNGEEVPVYILEQTVITGITYVLVTDQEDDDEDGNAFILKDVSAPEDEEACYVEVEDDTEYDAVARVFAEMMDEVDLV